MKSKSVKEIKEIIENISTDKYLEYIDILKNDERKSVQSIAVKMAKKLDAIRKEEERLELINTYENEGYSKGYLRKTTWLPRHRKMKPFPATAPQEKSHVRNWRSKGHWAPLMRPTKFPEIPVSLERNTEVFRHPLL